LRQNKLEEVKNAGPDMLKKSKMLVLILLLKLCTYGESGLRFPQLSLLTIVNTKAL
jgi:hypothetical protein